MVFAGVGWALLLAGDVRHAVPQAVDLLPTSQATRPSPTRAALPWVPIRGQHTKVKRRTSFASSTVVGLSSGAFLRARRATSTSRTR